MNILTKSFFLTCQVIIFLGPPGAGKGTQAASFSKSIQIPHISTGDLFRAHLKKETDLGKQAKKYIEKGELVPDELVLDILKDRVDNSDCENGYILDGFPRTINQAKNLDNILKEKDSLKVIYLNVPDSVLIERITGRLSCPNCLALYHKKFSPPKVDFQCDNCNETLIQRKDDTEEIIKKRLTVYHAQTKPLIEYYKSKNVLFEVDDSQGKNKEVIFNEIKSNLDKQTCDSYSN